MDQEPALQYEYFQLTALQEDMLCHSLNIAFPDYAFVAMNYLQ
ncbi:hypothetical protein J532_4621, partial [Acinetobacter baumannii 940793]